MNFRGIVAGIWRGFAPLDEPPAMTPTTGLADLVKISKGERRMELKREGKVLKRYRVALGFTPRQHKEREGDGRTPEGHYTIDARNPRSEFHRSLRIPYPDSRDDAHAAELGEPAGGDIYIHGVPNGWRKLTTPHSRKDWTTGCVAVIDAEIREIWSLVPTGARVVIHP